ncbi:4'-phosphopantetheinyl transferase family protein [Sciscionella marina]|uniref:4'-phosphopantetheinyl transferase family protein n=1 Tax=Sciscionella marina TaxID=508770 RepID=UPI00036E131B|nr:4'-phosphopantetheinyl transferase superfamily protein [Sciscionella marina]
MARCVVHIARPVTDPDRWRFLLDEGEQARADRFRQAIDTARFVTGRAVAKLAIADHLGRKPADVWFRLYCANCDSAEHGKPVVDGVEFSIAHSGSFVLVAVTGEIPVGVDVEFVNQRTDVDSLAGSVLSETERAEFTATGDAARRAAFFTYWARKEALVKSTGLGLSGELRSVSVTPADADPGVVSWNGPEKVWLTDLALEDYEDGTDYRAALAALTTEELEVVFQHFAA